MPSISCPRCPAKLKLPDKKLAGKKTTCPRCGHRFAIEFSAAAEYPVGAPVAPPPDARDPAFTFDPNAADAGDQPVRRKSSSGLLGFYAAAALGLIGMGVGAFFLLGPRGHGKQEVAKHNTPTKIDEVEHKKAEPLKEKDKEPDKPKPPDPEPKPDPPKPEPKPEPEPPTTASLPVPVNMVRPLEDKPILVLDPGGHTAMIEACFLLPGNQEVVTVSLDKTIRLWSVTTGEPLRVLRLPVGPGQDGAIYAAALTPDGKRLAVGGSPYGRGKHGVLIHIIDLEAGKVVKVLKGHKHVVLGLAFSPDGQQLASCSYDKTARLYSLETGETLREFAGHEGRVKDVAFAPDGKHLATAGADQTARIWSIETGKELALLKGHSGDVNCVAWSRDGKTVATGSADATLRTWKTTGAAIRTYQHGTEKIQISSLEFTKEDKEVLYTGTGESGRAGLLDLESGKFRVEFNTHTNTVLHGSLSSDGSLAVTAGGNNQEAYVWKTEDGVVVQELFGPGKTIWALGWSPDGKQIAWGNENMGDPQRATTPLQTTFDLEHFDFGPEPAKEMHRSVFTRDGFSIEPIDLQTIAIKKGDQVIHKYVSELQKERIYSMTMMPNKKAVIGGSYGLSLIDLETGKLVREFEGHSGLILAVAPAPDGKHFISAGTDQIIYLWNPNETKPLAAWFTAGHNWVAWHEDGFYAASANGERLMGWQINHGPEQLASYHPALRFRASLHRPEVVRRIPETGSLEQAMALAKNVERTNVAAVLPPRVTIDAPAAPLTLEGKNEIIVKASAESSGDQPVLALRLLLDGRPYRGADGVRPVPKPGPGKVTAAWKVAVPPGKHVLAVQADSKVSKSISPSLEVASSEKPPPPNLYFVGVGISAYAGDLKLNAPAKDAALLAKAFGEKSKGAFGSVSVKLLTDGEATRAAIIKELDGLKSVMTANDVAIFHFAGHGSRDEADEFQMLPADIDLEALPKTGISGAYLKQTVANLPGRVLVILDVNHASSVAALPGKKPRPRVADDLFRDLVSEDYGAIVLASALGREVALEYPDVGHGYFAKGLADGLDGLADFNRDMVVYLHEVVYDTEQRATQLSRGLQHPIAGKPPAIRSFPLAKPNP